MKLLIVEDEAPAARRLERLAREHLGGRLTTVVQAPTAALAAAHLEGGGFDGMLLDLNLSGEDGFSVMRQAHGVPVVVVSASAERALEAFDHAVLDFVAKPVSAQRLARGLDRLVAAGAGQRPARLIVRGRGRADVVALERVVRIAGADDYAELVMTDGRRLLHDDTLAALGARLPAGFLRVHRSHIVNADHLTALTQGDGGLRVQLTGGETAPVSRRRAEAVRTALAGRSRG